MHGQWHQLDSNTSPMSDVVVRVFARALDARPVVVAEPDEHALRRCRCSATTKIVECGVLVSNASNVFVVDGDDRGERQRADSW